MSIYTDKRPFSRGMRFGWQTAKQIFDNFFLLITKFNVHHNAETGLHNTRLVADGAGTYEFDSGSNTWLLVGGEGNLPAVVSRVPATSAGQAKVVFPSSYANPTKYDIEAFAKTQTGGTEPVIINYMSKTGASCVIVMNSTSSTLYDGDFSLVIRKVAS